MGLEEGIEWIADDELVEVTPESIRLRKKIVKQSDRPPGGGRQRTTECRSAIAPATKRTVAGFGRIDEKVAHHPMACRLRRALCHPALYCRFPSPSNSR